jgi:hypothetical protein
MKLPPSLAARHVFSRWEQALAPSSLQNTYKPHVASTSPFPDTHHTSERAGLVVQSYSSGGDLDVHVRRSHWHLPEFELHVLHWPSIGSVTVDATKMGQTSQREPRKSSLPAEPHLCCWIQSEIRRSQRCLWVYLLAHG